MSINSHANGRTHAHTHIGQRATDSGVPVEGRHPCLDPHRRQARNRSPIHMCGLMAEQRDFVCVYAHASRNKFLSVCPSLPICLHICLSVCMYVCLYVWLCGCGCVGVGVGGLGVHSCMYACTHACLHACTHFTRMYNRTYMHECIYLHTKMHIYTPGCATVLRQP